MIIRGLEWSLCLLFLVDRVRGFRGIFGSARKALYDNELVNSSESSSSINKPSPKIKIRLSKVDSSDTGDDEMAYGNFNELHAKDPAMEGPKKMMESGLEGDEKFIEKLQRFRHEMYPEGDELDKKFAKVLASSRRQRVLSDSKHQVYWQPIQCSLLEIKFKIEETLADEGEDDNIVYRVRDTKTNEVFVYKIFGRSDEYTNEVAFYMVASNHPNIPKPICVQRDESRRTRGGILLEYIDGESSLKAAARSETTIEDITIWSAKLLNTVRYIHQKGFVHDDLKPDNVMVRSNGDIVVIDFGFAVPIPFAKHLGRGNTFIKAPELSALVGGLTQENIDWWAYGSTVASWLGFKYMSSEFLAREGHRGRYVMIEIKSRRKYGFRHSPTDFPDSLKALLYLLLSPNTNARKFNNASTFAFLRGLQFFAGINWNALDQVVALYSQSPIPHYS